MNTLPSHAKGFVIPVVIAVVLIVGLLAGGYWYLSQKTGDANPLTALQKATSGQSLNPDCDYKDPDLCKFLNNWARQSKYEMVMTATGADSGMTSGTFRIDGNDKAYTKFSVKDPDTGKTEAYETVSIGNTTYTKDASDGKWWMKVNKETSVDESTADSFKFEIPSATASAEERTTFEKEGKEACGKLTCFKYHSMTGGSPEMTYLWFDDTQYLLRKMEVISGEGERSTITYQYDNVSVTAPSPTKEAKDDQIIMPNGSTMDIGAGMTQEQIDAMEKAMEGMGH